MQFAMPAQKMQKEACAGAWHRLPFWAEMQKKGTVVFLCISAIRTVGTSGKRAGRKLDIAKHGMVLSENPPVLLYYCLF